MQCFGLCQAGQQQQENDLNLLAALFALGNANYLKAVAAQLFAATSLSLRNRC